MLGMPRTARIAPGGMVFHVLNRANARVPIFEKDHDFLAFERALCETVWRSTMRILGYLVMPNHWHLVLWPRGHGDLGPDAARSGRLPAQAERHDEPLGPLMAAAGVFF